jgi:hypothetical protein
VSDRDRLGSDAELEELGDDVIIAQETAAHAPQRRVNVTTDHPSVVISEPPQAHPSHRSPPYRRPERMEQTVVIRDRQKLAQMRRQMTRPHQKKPVLEPRTVYLIAAAALASLAMGTLIAALVDSSTSNSPPTSVRVLPEPEPGPAGQSSSAPGPIDLDALPEPSQGGPRRTDAP